MGAIDRLTRRVPSNLTVAAIGGLLAAVLAGCGTAATPNPVASAASAAPAASVETAAPSAAPTTAPTTAATATSVPSAAPVAGGGSAAAWCGFVIEINTKYGYMTNKNYSTTPPSLDVQRQILTEALSRLDEWVAKTPPEIKDATAAEIAYFQRLKAYGDAHGWTDPAAFPPPTAAEVTLIGSLVPYQEKECGITFGK
jgi:hypothetical protein